MYCFTRSGTEGIEGPSCRRHTHGGQIAPFTWFTRRAFGKYTYGLQRFGRLQVLTSSGAGTWGPPMRVGSEAEVVLITFEGPAELAA